MEANAYWACGCDRGDKKHVENFDGKVSSFAEYYGDLQIYGRITLRWILGKMMVELYIIFISLIWKKKLPENGTSVSKHVEYYYLS